MFFSDLRVGLFVVYAALIVWRISVGAPEGYWPYMLGFAVLSGITRAIEHAAESSRLQRGVSYLASLDPATAQERIRHLWSAHARRTYRDLLRDEGMVEQEGGVERFPYTASERRAFDAVFWIAAISAVVAFALLFLRVRRGTWMPWLFWGVGAMCVAAAGWARHRASELASVLEVSPFALTRVALDGTRLRIPWHHELVLQNQPRHRRVLLATARGSVVIALGYRRLGFERLLRLTIEHGGFTPMPTEQAAGVTGEPPPEERTTS